MPFLRDSMVGADGQALGNIVSGSAHYGAAAGDSAGDWMPNPAFNTSQSTQFAIAGNRAYALNAPRALFLEDSNPASADYDVNGQCTVITAVGKTLRAAGRMDCQAPEGSAPPAGSPVTGTDTMITVVYDADAAAWKVDQRVAGTETNLISWAEALVATDQRSYKLRMRGSTVELFVDGVSRGSATTTVLGAGRVGLMASSAATSTTGVHLDWITAVNAWEADAVLSDRCAGVDTENLTAHAADSGDTWAKHPSHAGNFLVTGGRGESGSGTFAPTAIYASTAPAHYLSSGGVAPTDLDGDLVVVARGATRSGVYVTVRADPATDTAYLIGYSGTQWEIVKRVAGVNTVLDSFVASMADRFHYLCSFELRGTTTTTITAAIDGVDRLSASDASSPLTAGHVGVYAPDTATSTGKCHIDQVTVCEPVAPPADVVLWDGGFDDGDPTLPAYTFTTQIGNIRQYNTHEAMVGPADGLMGLRGVRYRSILLQQDVRRVPSGYAARMEVRRGDTGGSNARNRVMGRINEGSHHGWDEWEVYYGFSVLIPSPYNPVVLDVNTIWSSHNRSLVASPDDPGVEPWSLLIDEATFELRLRIRGGWADVPGGSNYVSFREWVLGVLEPDKWMDFVIYLRNSPDAGVGRVACWFGPEDDTLDNVVPLVPIATTDASRASYSEIGYYRETLNDLPQVIYVDQFKTATTFDAANPRP